MKVSAVIFDLFGTLVPPFNPTRFKASLTVMAQALGMEPSIFINAWTKETNGARFTGQFLSNAEELRYICRSKGVTPTDAGIAEAIRHRNEFTTVTLSPRPDAVSTIQQLQALGLRIGLISDCSREVPELWQQTPFHDLIKTPLFSCVFGRQKPDPAIYNEACKLLDVPSSSCLYIGDGGSRELAGARTCGLTPYLLLPPDQPRPTSPTWEGHTWDGPILASLSEILSIVTPT